MANALETTKHGKSVLRVGSEEIRTISWPLSNSPKTVIYRCEALEQHTALLPSLARTVIVHCHRAALPARLTLNTQTLAYLHLCCSQAPCQAPLIVLVTPGKTPVAIIPMTKGARQEETQLPSPACFCKNWHGSKA